MTKPPKAHLFITSALHWRSTGRDYTVAEALKFFEREKKSYWIYYVPLPPDASYEIEQYAPQVPGAFILEEVLFKDGRKVKKEN